MTFSGKGGRKPQLDLNVDIINLDKSNPRLLPYFPDSSKATQFDLLSLLYKYFDTEVIAMSLAENGYFDEEPIIVVPNNLPPEFSYKNYENPDDLAKEIAKLVETESLTFTVVEGNRRISSIKMLTDHELRVSLGIDKSYPKCADEERLADITRIPCIIYESREEVSAYLGVRHIAGLLKWEAFAKAAYISDFVENEIKDGQNINDAVKQVQRVVGDRSDSLKKQLVTYRIFIQARDDIGFDVQPIIHRFSLLTVAYNSAPIRDYLGVKPYSKVDLDEPIVENDNLEKLDQVLGWIYGNKAKNFPPVLTDSRRITDRLSHVVKQPEAVQYLQTYNDLEGAYERTSGEREYLMKKLTDAFRAVQTSLGFAYKHADDQELLAKVDELEQLIRVLKSNLGSNK